MKKFLLYNEYLNNLINSVNYDNGLDIENIEKYFNLFYKNIDDNSELKREKKVYDYYYKKFHKKILNRIYFEEKYKKLSDAEFLEIISKYEVDNLLCNLNKNIEDSNELYERIRIISNPLRYLIDLLYKNHDIDYNERTKLFDLTFDRGNSYIIYERLNNIVQALSKNVIYDDLLFIIFNYISVNQDSLEKYVEKKVSKKFKKMDECNKNVQGILKYYEVKNCGKDKIRINKK